MGKTKIEWCDHTVNPIVGCSHCSPGCDNCYAEKFAWRLAINPKTAKKYAGVVDTWGRWARSKTRQVRYFPDWYEKLPVRKPKRIFLGSMCDIFHPAVKDEWLEEIFQHISYEGAHAGHLFFLLTKRIERGSEVLKRLPLPKNVWLGVTICNQEEADEKLPILMKIPATKRFVSVEPMLGPIDLDYCVFDRHKEIHKLVYGPACLNEEQADSIVHPLVDWVICGGETGPKARPLNPKWVRELRDQCLASNVPFFFKSFGEWSEDVDPFMCARWPQKHNFQYEANPPTTVYFVGKKRAGRRIDGEEYNQFPGGGCYGEN